MHCPICTVHCVVSILCHFPCSVHFVLYAASNEQYRKAYAFFFRQVLCMGNRKRVSDITTQLLS